ncbi:MAG TPA: tetraacyldisaccharide 4'-kinase, partial [Alphaproteobacteria bacterium]|nr:tetraacyldisaccharide 4'-kinase [Alphaproteobacteria bacterium]
MVLKTPTFWYRHTSAPAPLAEYALAPLAWLYGLGHNLNQSLKTPYKSAIPVICIGNAVAGGGGKTPAALAVMALIKNQKLFKNPCFLSRGYGGTLPGPALVNDDMNAAQTGDEPLLLARAAPTVIARDRVEGAKFCAAQGFDAIVLDGMQNPSLHKDITLMVIDGTAGFGNGKTIPAGPLREPLDSAFARADAFILIGKDERGTVPALPPGKPLFTAHIKPMLPDEPTISSPFLAFAGLGRPEKFYRMLVALGANIKAWRP